MIWRINIFLAFILSSSQTGSLAQIAPFGDSLAAFHPPKISSLDSSYLQRYPVVDFDLNYFQFYTEESHNWEILFEKMSKMKETKQGKLNFYHAGGSHLQADIYTHEVRTKFQSQNELLEGERNWVFPYDLAKTNNPWNYEFTSPNIWKRYRSVVKAQANEAYGLSGIKISCTDSISSMSFSYDKTKVKPVIQRIRIFHNKGVFPFQLDWKEQKDNVEHIITDTIIGFTEVKFKRPFITFEVEFERTIPIAYELEIYGLQLMNYFPGVSYSNIGTNGAALWNYLACARLEEELKMTPPDFFAFSVGTNDGNVPPESFDPEEYKNNLERLMKIVLRTNPECALLLTVPNDSYFHRSHLNPNIEKERTVIRELAQKYNCPVWDLYGIMGGLGSSKTWYMNKLMQKDLVHFTKAGYHLKGDLFYDAFEKGERQFETRKIKTAKN